MRRPGRGRASEPAGRRRARRIPGVEGDHATPSIRRPDTLVVRPERVSNPGPELVRVRSAIWYRAILGAELIAAGGLTALCEQFAVAIREAGEPAGACLFAITEPLDGDCEGAPNDTASTIIFFSPSAIAVVPTLLARCDAHPSTAPDRARAALLVGRPSDWDLLPQTTH